MLRCKVGMHHRRLLRPEFACVALLSIFAPACQEQSASSTEMREATLDVIATGQSQSVENDIIEITTGFTIGGGVRAAVGRAVDFAQAQLPCATITSPDPNSLQIELGTAGDSCTYHGRSFSGTVTVAYSGTDDELVVQHTYQDVSDGRVSFDGEATVTWSGDSRHIVSEFSMTGPRGELTARSDRTQTRLGAAGEGIRVSGDREWHNRRGDWQLEIDDVEIRAIDPIPQAGEYRVYTPRGAEVVMAFARVDDNTIKATVTGGRLERVFYVSSSGEVDEGP